MLGVLTPFKVEKDNLKVEEQRVSESWDSKSESKKDDQEGQAICLKTPLSEWILNGTMRLVAMVPNNPIFSAMESPFVFLKN